MSFVHLHTHTEYSLLDGSNKIKAYVNRCKELGMNAAAITDHGNMYGAVEFYLECQDQGIKPVIGCEVYVAPGSRFDKTAGKDEDRYYHLILLAENNIGYQNLSHIVSRGFTEGFYYKPRVDKELLREFHEGIICCSACLAGEIARDVVRGNIEEAKAVALEYQDIFGRGNFFLELQDHGYADQQTVNAALLSMSRELDIPLVATNDCHYTYAEDAEAHDILLCVQTKTTLSDENRMRYPGGQFYVKSEEEMLKLFPYAKEAVENTQKIADRCNITIEFGHTKVPHFEVPEGYDSWSYLNHLCDTGFAKNYPDDDGTVRKRMDYELSVIHSMGFVDYFLIVWDYINWSRKHGIAVGPGRGSAAGSVVSYCIGITQLDPMKYDLLFERFLNPERVSMPDIDVDFEYERRQEVIDYVTEKYGKDCVVRIVTFGTMAAKGAIRDVGRAMDYPYSFCNDLAKMIPDPQDGKNVSIDQALELNPDFGKRYREEPDVARLIDMAKKLENLPRNTSVHAAGVVICAEPAENLIPLQTASDGSVTTQFTMTRVEQLGLLKMDFLGLKTLGVIKNAARLASQSIEAAGGSYPKEPVLSKVPVTVNPMPVVDPDHISYKDAAVYSYIGSGKTNGVFQLESGGMQGFMKELKPNTLEDVIAGIALYRPGPMDFIPKYIDGKQSGGDVPYEAPQLKPILSPTYGCIVYQEQVMQIVQDLGGYTLGRADLVRRAMSKKKAKVMAEERANFVNGNAAENVPGCVSKGIPADVANGIYDTMVDFAKYAFNKSHAACYAVVTYQTAWLKYYYPAEYMAALMTSVMDKPDKITGYILSTREMGIKILPPDINEGEAGFSVVDGDIKYALTAVKGVGVPIVTGIIKERTENGKFRDLKDFITRMTARDRLVNKRVVEVFIKAGAFDCFGKTRKQLMIVYPQIMDEIQAASKKNIPGQISMFDLMDAGTRTQYEVVYPNVGEYGKETMLGLEKEVLGVYATGHPIEEYTKFWKRNVTKTAADFILDEDTGLTAIGNEKRARIGGIIADVKIHYPKSGRPMAFVTLEDLTGSVEVIVFASAYEKYGTILMIGNKVFIDGYSTIDDDRGGKLKANRITAFADVPKKVWVRFDSEQAYNERAALLENIIGSDIGKDRAYVFCKDTKKRMPIPGKFIIGQARLDAMKENFGEDNVVIV